MLPGFFFLVPWIVYFPVIGLLINMFLGRRLGERGVGIVAILGSGLTWVVSLLLAYSLALHPEPVRWTVAQWIHIGDLQLDWTFRVDTLSVTMMLVVSTVGTLIHIYAVGYMHEDVRFKGDPGRFPRFFVYMNLFIAMMMILVGGDSYLMLFVGWEGVGLCSMLLISFWYELDLLGRPAWDNAKAGVKAMVANRIGDFGFLIAAFLIFWTFGTLQFDGVFEKVQAVSALNSPMIVLITLFLLLGVTGKSAQIPLYVWLPDAMAGPTPVSALIHAATMVTAGVYLVARSFPLYAAAPQAQFIVALVGGVTALFAAGIASTQFDIKKVLAYSTISQLGFMVAAVGMGAFAAGMFHLITHAFFKALLFLSAGSLILGVERGHHLLEHQSHAEAKPSGKPAKGAKKAASIQQAPGTHEAEAPFDANDMRNMGGMRKTMPVTFWVYLAGTLALAGVIPFAGFWSKDEILAESLALGYGIVFWLLTLAGFLTAFYMGRQVCMVFFGEPRHQAAARAVESPKLITIPLGILAAFSTLGGLFNLPFPGLQFLSLWLKHTIEPVEPGVINWVVAAAATVIALLGLYIAWLLYGRNPLRQGEADPLRRLLGPLFTGLNRKWFVDEGYQVLFVNRYKDLARFLAVVIDGAFWHDWFHNTVLVGGFNALTRILLNRYADQQGINSFFDGLADWIRRAGAGLRRVENGFVRSYALAVLVGVVAIIGYIVLK